MTADPTPVLGAEETVLNEGGYSFVIRDDYAVITGYSGPGGTLDIPWSLGGVEVREIREESFAGNETLIVVNMPGSITKIGARAFAGCTNLKTLTFKGTRPPFIADDVFPEIPTVYVPRVSLSRYESALEDAIPNAVIKTFD